MGFFIVFLSLKSEVEILPFSRFSSGNYYLAWFAKERGNCGVLFSKTFVTLLLLELLNLSVNSNEILKRGLKITELCESLCLGRAERDPNCCPQGKGRKNLLGAFAQLAASAGTCILQKRTRRLLPTARVMGRVRDIAIGRGAAGEERKINNHLRLYLSSEWYHLA